MKINSNNYASNQNQRSKRKLNKTTNFGNGSNALVATATYLENNGFLGEFLAVDGIGMITPRTVQGYTRNKEELGHLNHKAGREELTRELLSGPAYFFVPLGVLTAASMLRGKAAKVTTKTLNSFEKIMNKTAPSITDIKDGNHVKQKFLDTLFDKMFKDYKESPEEITKVKKTFTQVIDGNITKKQAKKDLNESITTLNKANGRFTNDTLLVNIGEETIKDKTSSHNIKITELVDDVPNYLEDFVKKSHDSIHNNENFISKFHKNAQKIRKTTNIIAVSALAAFLSIVPKLYQVDKKFPGVEGLDTSNAPADDKLFAKPSFKGNSQKKDINFGSSVNFKGSIAKPVESKGTKLFNWAAEKCSVENNGALSREMFTTIAGVFMMGSRFTEARSNDERREVLVRDIPGVFTAVYGAPLLNALMAYGSTKQSGIPILEFNKNKQSIFNANLASQKQVTDWFSGFEKMKDPLNTMAQTIDEQGGNIKKVMDKFGFNQELKDVVKKDNASNSEILEALEKEKDSAAFKTLENKVKTISKDNPVLKIAKRNQAIVKLGGIGFTAALLGYFLPRLNIVTTRNKYKNTHKTPQAPAQPKQNIEQTKLNQTFKDFIK